MLQMIHPIQPLIVHITALGCYSSFNIQFCLKITLIYLHQSFQDLCLMLLVVYKYFNTIWFYCPLFLNSQAWGHGACRVWRSIWMINNSDLPIRWPTCGQACLLGKSYSSWGSSVLFTHSHLFCSVDASPPAAITANILEEHYSTVTINKILP